MACRFSAGWTESELCGRKPYKYIKAAKDVSDSDRPKTVREVAEGAGTSKSITQRILTSELNMSHVSARWVPRLLKAEEEKARVTASKTFLKNVERDPTFLSRIINTDETWVHYNELENKRMLMAWKYHDSPPPKKAKVVKSMYRCVSLILYLCIFFHKSLHTP